MSQPIWIQPAPRERVFFAQNLAGPCRNDLFVTECIEMEATARYAQRVDAEIGQREGRTAATGQLSIQRPRAISWPAVNGMRCVIGIDTTEKSATHRKAGQKSVH